MADNKAKPKNAGGGRGFINPPTVGEREMMDQYNEQKQRKAEENAPTTKTEMGKLFKKGGVMKRNTLKVATYRIAYTRKMQVFPLVKKKVRQRVLLVKKKVRQRVLLRERGRLHLFGVVYRAANLLNLLLRLHRVVWGKFLVWQTSLKRFQTKTKKQLALVLAKLHF